MKTAKVNETCFREIRCIRFGELLVTFPIRFFVVVFATPCAAPEGRLFVVRASSLSLLCVCSSPLIPRTDGGGIPCFVLIINAKVYHYTQRGFAYYKVAEGDVVCPAVCPVYLAFGVKGSSSPLLCPLPAVGGL